jgi:hypothetical protein
MTKTMMFTVAAALLVVPAMAQAQSQVTATASVAQYSLVSGDGDLAFGTVDRTAGKTIDPTGTDAATRTLEFNHNVTVTFLNVPTNLAQGTLLLPVSITCAAQVAGTWSAASACSSASLNMDVGTALTTGTLGFGGTITGAAAAAAVAGAYTGQFDIRVDPRGT